MVNKNFIPVNKEEEYWFIRWVVMRRNYIKAVAELEQVKRIHARQLAKDPLNLEIERLKKVLTEVRKEFIPLNPAKRIYKKAKTK